MKPRLKTSALPKSPAVVGTIHTPAALRAALRLRRGQVDLLEVRVDHFLNDLPALRRALPKLRAPLIVTVRHPGEGGAAPLSVNQRAALYREFLPCAAWIDVELRSAAALRRVLEEAATHRVGRILSWHDFKSTPSLAALEKRWSAARAFTPDVIKFATHTRTAAHFATLLVFLARRRKRPMTSAMGMGEFGKVSRLALARAGSVLNYGYLGELQVPGQWPAVRLKELLARL
jgi:3-dehydroquinate dehydratase-1